MGTPGGVQFSQGTAKMLTRDLTNDIPCPVCQEVVTLGTDGHGELVGRDPNNRIHRHEVVERRPM